MLDVEDKERLDGILEKLVQAIEDAYRHLENLKNVLISLLEQLQVAELRTLRMLPNII
jgi:hypothetical protein